MAVPLIEKGVVVVAVGYDIAPKGSLFILKLLLFLGKENVSVTPPPVIFHMLFR